MCFLPNVGGSGFQVACVPVVHIAFICSCFYTSSSDRLGHSCGDLTHGFPVIVHVGPADFGFSSDFCGYDTKSRNGRRKKNKDKLNFIKQNKALYFKGHYLKIKTYIKRQKIIYSPVL